MNATAADLARSLALACCLLPALIGASCGEPAGDASLKAYNSSADAAPRTTRRLVARHFATSLGLGLENVYWGELHSHTSLSLDAVGFAVMDQVDIYDLAEGIDYARQVEGLDFLGFSDHAELTNPLAMPLEHRQLDYTAWQSTLATLAAKNDEDFSDGEGIILFAGWEYTNTVGCATDDGSSSCTGLGGSNVGFGHKNVVFKSLSIDQLPADRYGLGGMTAEGYQAPTAYDLWDALAPYRGAGCLGCESLALTIPHTMSLVGEASGEATDHHTDWDALDPEFVRNVELYSKWGSSEGPPPAGCPAETVYDYDPTISDDSLTVRATLHERWLAQGDPSYRLSFLGGTDNHWGRPAIFEHPSAGGLMQFRGGLTGLIAPARTRDALWSSLNQRHTLAATTSPDATRLPVLLSVETAGAVLLMGDGGPHDGLAQVRVLAPEVAQLIEIVVDGCLQGTVQQNAAALSLALAPGRHYIYARVTQEAAGELHQAWTSPVYLGEPAR